MCERETEISKIGRDKISKITKIVNSNSRRMGSFRALESS